MRSYFSEIEPLRYDPEADDLSFRHYDPDREVAGKRLQDQLRFAVAYWHSLVWDGSDPFGGGTFQRPWFPHDTMEHARAKADAAFEMFRILRVPFFAFHDHDVRPEGGSLQENHRRLNEIADVFEAKMAETGVGLLWGTANLFTHRRFMSGAATNPDPDVFAWSASSVRACLEVTHRLGGRNYVLWGGREGYETLLNTDLNRELEQMGRFLSMVVEHKHKIGFEGQILIEPKPQEPTKHQYDYDVATVYGFLRRFGLENEVKLNIEQGHAILAGHSFEHEIALAQTLGVFGSIDMNRNDYQSGWDTDQFPNNVAEVALAYYEILRGGGFGQGGTNFDAKLRRQSLDPVDLIAAHAGAMDVCARGLEAAARMIADDALEGPRRDRYAGWETETARAMLAPGASLADIADRAETSGLDPAPRSGRQEILENVVNRYV
ncbi:xylose isomerase [uncultured Jannaschia sp.]|uniref:xylose isomerase n=1 Tax=uncultured Jannaschia sp. TaxID=293347 RepID=UPI00262E8A58|nr:xylose isomerase [uncultured Jannaschia sp.]